MKDLYLADLRVNHGNSGGPVYSARSGAVIGVCVAFELADIESRNLPEAGSLLKYNAGISVIVPALYVSNLLKKNGLKWQE